MLEWGDTPPSIEAFDEAVELCSHNLKYRNSCPWSSCDTVWPDSTGNRRWREKILEISYSNSTLRYRGSITQDTRSVIVLTALV